MVIGDLRNRLYQLNLADREHLKLYEDLLFLFIRSNEGERLSVYRDIKGYKTISIGYNMDTYKSKEVWQQIFANQVSFDAVYNGKAAITAQQSRKLYEYKIRLNRLELEVIYSNFWCKFKANERLMIEDLYWNGGNKLAGKATRFFCYITKYASTKKLEFLLEALTEIKERSNKEKIKGIQNRRNLQSEIGNSSKCII